MQENLKDLSIEILLSRYKRTARNAPMVMYASDEELDDYYNKLLEIENEIIRRTQITTG